MGEGMDIHRLEIATTVSFLSIFLFVNCKYSYAAEDGQFLCASNAVLMQSIAHFLQDLHCDQSPSPQLQQIKKSSLQPYLSLSLPPHDLYHSEIRQPTDSLLRNRYLISRYCRSDHCKKPVPAPAGTRTLPLAPSIANRERAPARQWRVPIDPDSSQSVSVWHACESDNGGEGKA